MNNHSRKLYSRTYQEESICKCVFALINSNNVISCQIIFYYVGIVLLYNILIRSSSSFQDYNFLLLLMFFCI
ncbi:unnamed protein product [Rotaria magnacalcarata]